jgi:hypothetical protein
MAAPTEVYIDPSIAGASGAGTIGDPYGDIQHALDTVTRDGTNGDRFNIKAGTDEVLAAALDFSTYGVPTIAAPWICQGYTTAAADGGIGGISGGGSVGIITGGAIDYLTFADMHLHNTGANPIISADNYLSFINCEIDNTSSNGIDVDQYCLVLNCHIHNVGATGVLLDNGGMVLFNTFENGTNDFTVAIHLKNPAAEAMFNVIDIDGSSDGILMTHYSTLAAYNSIYSNGGTGQGIVVNANLINVRVFGNIVEGFSGLGGIGIQLGASTMEIYGHNAFYNNTTNLSDSSEIILVDLTAQ